MQSPIAERENLIRVLAEALEAAELYLNSYDTSAPSRIKALTRASVAEALGKLCEAGKLFPGLQS